MDRQEYRSRMAERLIDDLSLEQLKAIAFDDLSTSWSDRAISDGEFSENVINMPMECDTARAWQEGKL